MEKDIFVASGSLYLHQCGEEHCASRHGFGPAVRDHYLLHCVFSGCGTFRRGDEVLQVAAGECFLIRPGERCYYEADETEPWHYGWVGVNGREASSVLEACGFLESTTVMPMGDPNGVWQSLQRLTADYGEQGNSFGTMAELYRLLDRLCGGVPVTARPGPTFRRIEEYMQRNYSYPLTVQELAEQVHLDRSQLFRVIKKETGLSPSQYIVDFRLRVSLRMLVESRLTVTEIMYSVGFEDLSRFSRCFKRRFGSSPRRYRERLHQGKSTTEDFDETE